MSVDIVRVAGPDRIILDATLLLRAEAVHRQLRPGLDADYLGNMQRVVRDGAEIALAVDTHGVLGVAVFRLFENTHVGLRCYLDDLVTDESRRSSGVGHALIDWLEHEARARGCACVDLESGVQRGGAHRFYFREGYIIPSFSFRKSLVA